MIIIFSSFSYGWLPLRLHKQIVENNIGTCLVRTLNNTKAKLISISNIVVPFQVWQKLYYFLNAKILENFASCWKFKQLLFIEAKICLLAPFMGFKMQSYGELCCSTFEFFKNFPFWFFVCNKCKK
jgi:hypothetical protein